MCILMIKALVSTKIIWEGGSWWRHFTKLIKPKDNDLYHGAEKAGAAAHVGHKYDLGHILKVVCLKTLNDIYIYS